MTRNQEERLDELADQLAQLKSSLQDFAGILVDAGGDDNPDDEPDDSGDAADTLDTMLAQLEDFEASLDELRETLQG
ncbi:MAG: hypothetical protein K6E40_15810 [Desulfovibrio sp.]|nr:hypothetical protein [Desulfovibrio sp.]